MKRSLVLFATLAAVGAQAADIVYDFDSAAEAGRWKAANVDPTTYLPIESADVTWNAAPKDIGASEALFSSSGLFILLATDLTGDLSGYYGGTVSYLLSDTSHDAGALYPNLLLVGTDTATNGLLAIGYRTPAPGSTPTAFAMPLDATDPNWITSAGKPVTAAQFKSVLGHLLGFGVNADWTTGGTDVVTLDRVRVAAVPEPSLLAALGLGLVANRRRKRAWF